MIYILYEEYILYKIIILMRNNIIKEEKEPKGIMCIINEGDQDCTNIEIQVKSETRKYN